MIFLCFYWREGRHGCINSTNSKLPAFCFKFWFQATAYGVSGSPSDTIKLECDSLQLFCLQSLLWLNTYGKTKQSQSVV